MALPMLARFLLVLSLALVMFAAPAQAADGTQVPEANTLTLFALGLAGVILGRRLSHRKSDKS